MGLFNRKTDQPMAPGTAGAANTTTTTHRHGHGEKANTTGVSANSPYAFVNQRPSFGAWFKTMWIDILTMAAMGAVGLGVYEADPAPTRSFPVYFNNGEVVYPTQAYPLRKNIIPIWAAAIIASFIPIFIILVMQARVRSFWDANNGILGLLYSLICAAVFQVFLKWLIGGLRPHFLAVCKPNLPSTGNVAGNGGSGFDYLMYDRSICTGNKKDIDDSLESFPSGHSTAAFAGFVYLSLYLNAKLKLWANYQPRFWMMLAVYAPILGAVLIAGSLTIDEFHNWYDCLAGAIIGTICAFGAYRMMYAGIFDWTVNHIPLPRGNEGNHFDAHSGNYGGFENAMFTRKAGWGGEGGVGNHHGLGHRHANGNGVNPQFVQSNGGGGGMMNGSSTNAAPYAPAATHGRYGAEAV